jgi:hypothetical protein
LFRWVCLLHCAVDGFLRYVEVDNEP